MILMLSNFVLRSLNKILYRKRQELSMDLYIYVLQNSKLSGVVGAPVYGKPLRGIFFDFQLQKAFYDKENCGTLIC